MLNLFKVDPGVKIILVLSFTVLIFLVDKPAVIVCLLLSIFFLRIIAAVPLRGGGAYKGLFALVIFMVFLQVLFGPGERYIVKPLFPSSFPLLGGMGSLKWDGLLLGLVTGCRILALTLLLPLLTETTPAHKAAAALGVFGINYRASFIITTALNLVPRLLEEGRGIMDAQRLRGMYSFEKRSSLFTKLKAYSGIIVPLVLGAMRNAQKTGIAMDSRAFGVYRTRTWLDKPVMKKNDYILLVFCAFYCAAVLSFNYLLY